MPSCKLNWAVKKGISDGGNIYLTRSGSRFSIEIYPVIRK